VEITAKAASRLYVLRNVKLTTRQYQTIVQLMKQKAVIADASIVLAVLLEEPEKHSIIEATKGVEIKAPVCLRYEIGNALSAMAKRKRLTKSEIQKIISLFEVLPIQEVDIDLSDSLNIALKNNIYAYDAYYLSVAKKHKIPLLSLDRKMIEVAEKESITTKKIK